MRSYPETYNPEEGFRDKITLKLKRVLVLIEANRKSWSPDKTADISRCYHWFPREMKSETEQLRNSILMTCHYLDRTVIRH